MGRKPKRPENAELIFSGAFPSAYGAVKLASEQQPRQCRSACAASTPRFYMFERSAAHKLIAGPVSHRADLLAGDRRRRHRVIVLKVPVGTVIVTEQPVSRLGESIAGAPPGWYALRDDPALTGSEIVHVSPIVQEFGSPAITFGFTKKGRVAFKRVTRAIARRGRAQALGPVSPNVAAELSGHFALILDNVVKTRPIINFAEFPNGINGRVGAQISGGFANLQEARDLATILKIGPLPINLLLVRQTLIR
jgi:SecD/SecF fusion protein